MDSFGTLLLPPDRCIGLVSWRKFIDMVCLWILHSHSLHKDYGTLIVDDAIAVWRIWECSYVVEEMNSWLDSFTQNLALKIDGNWLGFWFDNHDLKLPSRLCTTDNMILSIKDDFVRLSSLIQLLEMFFANYCFLLVFSNSTKLDAMVSFWRSRHKGLFKKMEITLDQCYFLLVEVYPAKVDARLLLLHNAAFHSPSRQVLPSQGELWSSRYAYSEGELQFASCKQIIEYGIDNRWLVLLVGHPMIMSCLCNLTGLLSCSFQERASEVCLHVHKLMIAASIKNLVAERSFMVMLGRQLRRCCQSRVCFTSGYKDGAIYLWLILVCSSLFSNSFIVHYQDHLKINFSVLHHSFSYDDLTYMENTSILRGSIRVHRY